MSQRLNKREAIALFSTAKALAAALGISKSAVSQWSEGPIPRIHDLKIRYELKPGHFEGGAGARAKPPQGAATGTQAGKAKQRNT